MPIIETERLLLRNYTPGDAEDLHRVISNPDVLRYIDPRREVTLDYVKETIPKLNQRWADKGFGEMAIILKEEGDLIGYCGFKNLDNTDEIEILYGLEKKYWNKGIVTEAAKACLRYFFEQTQFDRLVAVAMPENTGSWRVMEKTGMEFERRDRFYDLDVVYYSLQRKNYRPDGGSYLLRQS